MERGQLPVDLNIENELVIVEFGECIRYELS